MFFSQGFSQCKPCNANWEQWCVLPRAGVRLWPACYAELRSQTASGGAIPGTDVAWQGHGRPSCCPAGSSCRYVNTNYYQCQPNSM